MKNVEKIAAELGLSKRLSEIQPLAQEFNSVNLEGITGFEPQLQVFDLKTHERIQKNWETNLLKNPKLFPGSLASVRGFRVKRQILEFRLQKSRFDIYDGLRLTIPSKIDTTIKPLDRDFCLPLSMGAVTVTVADNDNPEGCIIFGIRDKSTAFEQGRATTLPSGYYNPDLDRLVMGDPELHKWFMSIRFTTVRELLEETGLQDFRTLKYLGMFHADGGRNPLIAMTLELDLTVDHVQSIARDAAIARGKTFEISDYHFIPNRPEDVAIFIEKHPPASHDVAKLVWHFAHQ